MESSPVLVRYGVPEIPAISVSMRLSRSSIDGLTNDVSDVEITHWDLEILQLPIFF